MRFRLAVDGLEIAMLSYDLGYGRTLKTHLIKALLYNGTMDILSLVDVVRKNYEEYKYNEPKVFTAKIAELIKEGIIEPDE